MRSKIGSAFIAVGLWIIAGTGGKRYMYSLQWLPEEPGKPRVLRFDTWDKQS